ncbi:MAG: sugar phosphate isomerase/epimerase [Promethearchaeota archaeon]
MKPLKLAICNDVYPSECHSFEEVCRRVADLGYGGVELAPFTVASDVRRTSTATRHRLRAACEAAGLELVALHWLLVSPPGLSITTPDDRVLSETRDYFKALVEFASDLDVPVMVFGSPAQRNLRPEWSREEAVGRAVRFFRDACDWAAAHGVRVAFEPLAPDVTNFGSSVDEVLELARRVAHPAFAVHLDARAMASEASPPEMLVKRVGKALLAHFHANDPNGLGPGMGKLDLVPTLGALLEIDYDGWISVETFEPGPGPDAVAKRSLEYLVAALDRARFQAARSPAGREA